jgi:TPR repeat protein
MPAWAGVVAVAAILLGAMPAAAPPLRANEAGYAEAARRYRQLADAGDVRAQYYLGYLYETGQGIAQGNRLKELSEVILRIPKPGWG